MAAAHVPGSIDAEIARQLKAFEGRVSEIARSLLDDQSNDNYSKLEGSRNDTKSELSTLAEGMKTWRWHGGHGGRDTQWI